VRELDSRVVAFDLSGETWVAATTAGLLTSKDKGATWQGGPVMGAIDYVSVAAHGQNMIAARGGGLLLSDDGGQTWWPMGIPTAVTRIHSVAFSADGTLWLGSREGVYFTRDMGKSWMWVHRLPLVDVSDLYYDPQQNTILVSSRESDFIYAIDAQSLDWQWRRTGYKLLKVRPAAGGLLAASLNDGVLTEPHPAETQTSQR
jgi:hypothetical protein